MSEAGTETGVIVSLNRQENLGNLRVDDKKEEGRKLYFRFQPSDLSGEGQIQLEVGMQVKCRRLSSGEASARRLPARHNWAIVKRVVMSQEEHTP
ncbi:MAG: hypothetical protein HQ530_01120 [Parcubacteria group bacterium]|nr:hypothetical protein [Parcubacteria group bacterium]